MRTATFPPDCCSTEGPDLGRAAACAWILAALLLIAAADASAHPGSAIAVSGEGVVFFVDTGDGIFSIGRDGRLVRHPGPAFHWFALDRDNRFGRTTWPPIPGGELRYISGPPGVILSSDVPVTIGGDGRFYYADREGERVRIASVDAGGRRSIRALLPPITSEGRAAAWVNGLAAGPNGSLFYTEDRAVKRVDAGGRVTTVATNVSVPNCTAIPGIGPAQRPYLRDLAVDGDGTAYVAASGCGAVLKIDTSGRSSVVLRSEAPWSPTAVAVRNGELYVLEYLHTPGDDRRQWLPRVRKVARGGAVTTVAQVRTRTPG